MRKFSLFAAVVAAAAFLPASAQAHCCWRAHAPYYIDAPFVEDLPADEVAPNVYVVYEPPGPRTYPYLTSRFTRGARWHRHAVYAPSARERRPHAVAADAVIIEQGPDRITIKLHRKHGTRLRAPR